MNSISRGMRIVWLGGFILLLGTIVGAGWVLNQPASGTTPAAPPEPSLQWVVGPGFVDTVDGITKLDPVVAGRVDYVLVAEGDEVKEGDMLFSLDNTVQKDKLRMVDAELAAAQQQVAEAEEASKKHRHEIEIQKLKIEEAEFKLEGAKKERDYAQNMLDAKRLSAEEAAVYENKVKAGESGVKALKEGLALLQDIDPKVKVKLAQETTEAKKAQRDLAQRAVFECDVYAPADGSILRLFATRGDVLGAASGQHAVYFCPSATRIVRMELLQEFAGRVKKGQTATIEDDTRNGAQWKGKVERVGEIFGQRRAILQEPFQYNDVRTLECIVSLDAGGPPVRIGQRMRVTIK